MNTFTMIVKYDPFESGNPKIFRDEPRGVVLREHLEPGEWVAVSGDYVLDVDEYIPVAGDTIYVARHITGKKTATRLVTIASVASLFIPSAGPFVSAGVYHYGMKAINQWWPIRTKEDDSSQSYKWGYSPNESAAHEIPMPIVCGVARIVPVVKQQYVKITGTSQELNVLYGLTCHEVSSITGVRVNDNPIANITDATIATRLGTNSQTVIDAFQETFSNNPEGVTLVEGAAYQTFTASGEFADGFQLDFAFPGGMYGATISSGGHVKIFVEYSTDNGANWNAPVQSTTVMVAGANGFHSGDAAWVETDATGTAFWAWKTSTEAVYLSLRTEPGAEFSPVATHPLKVRVRSGTSSLNEDLPVILTNFSTIVNDPFTYPNEALLGISALATEQVSGSLRTTVIITRGDISAYNTGTLAWDSVASSTPAWIIYDLLTNGSADHPTYVSDGVAYGAGVSKDDLDYDSFKSVADWQEDTGETHGGLECNLVLDGSSTIWDQVMQVCQIGRCMVVVDGTTFKLIADKAESVSQLFTAGNTVAGSYRTEWANTDDFANSLEVTYWPADQNYDPRTALVLTDGLDDLNEYGTPARVQLRGVTSFAQAYKHAKHILRSQGPASRITTFKVGVDALAAEIGDVVAFSAEVPQWGFGGRIVSYNSETENVLNWALTGVDYSWSSSYTYSAGDTVLYGGGIWTSLEGANLNNPPDSTHWESFYLRDGTTAFACSEYNAGTTYDSGDGVLYERVLFISKANDNSENTPPNETWWEYYTREVVLDRSVTMVPGTDYVISVRDADDELETATVYSVFTETTGTQVFIAAFSTASPTAEDVYAFGELDEQYETLRILNISQEEDQTRLVTAQQYNATVYEKVYVPADDTSALELYNRALSPQVSEVRADNFAVDLRVDWTATIPSQHGAWTTVWRDVTENQFDWAISGASYAWDTGKTYSVNETVLYGGYAYRSKTDSNSANTPAGAYTTYWIREYPTAAGALGVVAYAAGSTYAADDLVLYLGVVYYSKAGGNIGHTPPDGEYWAYYLPGKRHWPPPTDLLSSTIKSTSFRIGSIIEIAVLAMSLTRNSESADVSPFIRHTITGVPGAPNPATTFTATAEVLNNKAVVNLGWTATPAYDFYAYEILVEATSGGIDYANIYTITDPLQLTMTFTDLVSEVEFDFDIRILNRQYASSTWLDSTPATITPARPLAPAWTIGVGGSEEVADGSRTVIHLVWTEPVANFVLDQYEIRVQHDGDDTDWFDQWTVDADTLVSEFKDFTTGRLHRFQIRSRNTLGELSDWTTGADDFEITPTGTPLIIGIIGIEDGAVTNPKLAASGLDASKMTAGKISGINVETGAANQRVIMDASAAQLEFYDPDDNLIMEVGDEVYDTYPGMKIYADDGGVIHVMTAGGNGTVIDANGIAITWASGVIAHETTIDDGKITLASTIGTVKGMILVANDSSTRVSVFTVNNDGDVHMEGDVDVDGAFDVAGDIDVAGEIRVTDSGHFVGFSAPTLAEDTSYTWPAADGIENAKLQTDGAGTLSWEQHDEHCVQWSFSSKADGGGDYIPGSGYYHHSGTINDFDSAVTWGSADKAEGAHFYIVTSADPGVATTFTVTGTSFTDAGVRVETDTEVIVVADGDPASTYYETTKKWIGQISVVADIALNCNYGWAAYWDSDNEDFTITGLLAAWRGGANDSTCDIELIVHNTTGWTYNAGAAATPPTASESLQGSYDTEFKTVNDEYHRWKLSGLDIAVEGSGSEGVIVQITAGGADKTFDAADFSMTYTHE